MTMLIFLLILANFKFLSAINIDLILSLQEHFQSDLILFPKEHGNEGIVKKLLEYQEMKPKAFVGFLELNEKYKPIFSRFKNSIVIFDRGSNLIENLWKVQEMRPNVITSFIWIYFMKTDDEENNLNLLNIPYDSKFFIVKKVNSLSFEIIDVYQISSSSPKILSPYAMWENEELKLLRQNIFSNRMNLQGHEIKVGIPIGYINPKRYFHWKMLSDRMNFTIKNVVVPPGKFSLKNETKTGVYKLIHDQEADGASGGFAVILDRMDDFDFIFPTYIARVKLYVEVKQGLNWKAFIKSFETDVWISIIVWVISAYFLMRITNSIVSPIFKCRFEDPIFNVIRAFTFQGTEIGQTRFSYCICMLMPYLLGMVLFQYYSADLLSHLTVKDLTPPFRNIKGVIDDGTYEVAAFYYANTWARLRDSNGTKGRKIKNLVPLEEKRIYTGDVFHDLCDYRRVMVMATFGFNVKVNCSVVELQEPFQAGTLGILVTKHFPYRGVMTKLVRRLPIHGLAKLYQENFIIERETDHIIHPIELKTVFPVFLLLLSFLSLSVMIFSCEIMICAYKRKRGQCRIKIISIEPRIK